MSQITDEQVSHIRSKYSHLLGQKGEAYQTGMIRAIVAAETLSNLVNEIGFDYETFAMAVGCQHRTLQQSMMRAFAAMCNQLATDYAEGNFDGRNEAACKLALEITKLPCYLPHV